MTFFTRIKFVLPYFVYQVFRDLFLCFPWSLLQARKIFMMTAHRFPLNAYLHHELACIHNCISIANLHKIHKLLAFRNFSKVHPICPCKYLFRVSWFASSNLKNCCVKWTNNVKQLLCQVNQPCKDSNQFWTKLLVFPLFFWPLQLHSQTALDVDSFVHIFQKQISV